MAKKGKKKGRSAADPPKKMRSDGYVNMLNKYGTGKDASEQYSFTPDDPMDDIRNIA